MKTKVLFLVTLIAFMVTSCTTPETPTPTTVPQTPVPVTQVPQTATPEPRTLTVLASASLTESFTEIAGLFESQNPGVTIAISFGGTQVLAEQLAQGAPADVFASASNKYMDEVISAGRVTEGSQTIFAKNKLVVIFPKENPAGLENLLDLTKPGLIIDLANKSVPVGQYSIDYLDKTITNPAFPATYKDDFIKNVVSFETDVKSVVSKVVLGEADAGIVYLTDYISAADDLGMMDIPDDLNAIASYPIAPLTDAINADIASDFIDMVLSPDGQAIMAKYGFVVIAK